MANPSRMYIPDEYVRTGRSIDSSSSAKATISSKRSWICRRRRPWSEPLRYTFSRPVKSGWKPAPSSSSEPIRPPAATCPLVGLMIPATMRSSVVLPEPLRPISPTASPGATASETSCSAWTSCAAGAAARDEEVLQGLRLACADAEPPRDALDADLTCFIGPSSS